MANPMKIRFILLTLVAAALSSMSLDAQVQRTEFPNGNIYEGEWPVGEGVLYSKEDGLVLGTFSKGKPHGKCICYRPNGEVYWGDFKKGKLTGHAHLFSDEGYVVSGMYRNNRYHGLDTVYHADGSVYVGKFRNGRLKGKVYENEIVPDEMIVKKPSYPRIDFRHRQEEFLNDLEVEWQNYNMGIRQATGFVHPKFQGGNVDDFTLWVNSNVEYPSNVNLNGTSRTVLVEFTVQTDGSVSDIHTVFGSNPLLNKAAETAVSKSPEWQPAEHNGQKRGVRMTIPVVFNME